MSDQWQCQPQHKIYCEHVDRLTATLAETEAMLKMKQDDWIEVCRELGMAEKEREKFRQDLSTNRECYYQVVSQRNDALKECESLRRQLQSIKCSET